jgi:hypothetical protein
MMPDGVSYLYICIQIPDISILFLYFSLHLCFILRECSPKKSVSTLVAIVTKEALKYCFYIPRVKETFGYPTAVFLSLGIDSKEQEESYVWYWTCRIR